jgi:hypothetical protein
MEPASSVSWILDDEEAERRFRPAGPTIRIAEIDPYGGHPVWVQENRKPFLARVMSLNLGLTVLVPSVVGLGYWIHRWESYYQWLVGLFIVGFGWGVARYVRRPDAQLLERLNPWYPVPEPTVAGISPVAVFVLAVSLPLALAAAVLGGELFAERFFGVLLFAALTVMAFARWGDRPIAFMREFLLAHPAMYPEWRYSWARSPCGPNLTVLAVIMAIVVLVPVYASAAHAIVVLVAYCAWRLTQDANVLRQYGRLSKVLPYFLRRAEISAMIYLDYIDVPSEAHHIWAPPQTLEQRRTTHFVLLGPLYLTLIVGLSFYCPWEVFAALTVPDYEVGWFFIPRARPAPFEWAWGPLRSLWQADPRALFMLAIALACVLLLTLPAMILLAIYFPRLVELEQLHQVAKLNRRDLAR